MSGTNSYYASFQNDQCFLYTQSNSFFSQNEYDTLKNLNSGLIYKEIILNKKENITHKNINNNLERIRGIGQNIFTNHNTEYIKNKNKFSTAVLDFIWSCLGLETSEEVHKHITNIYNNFQNNCNDIEEEARQAKEKEYDAYPSEFRETLRFRDQEAKAAQEIEKKLLEEKKTSPVWFLSPGIARTTAEKILKQNRTALPEEISLIFKDLKWNFNKVPSDEVWQNFLTQLIGSNQMKECYICEGIEIPKMILDAQTPTFKTLFEGIEENEKTIPLDLIKKEEISESSRKTFLNYLKGPLLEKDINKNNVFEIYALAEFYEVKELMKKCLELIEKEDFEPRFTKGKNIYPIEKAENLGIQNIKIYEKLLFSSDLDPAKCLKQILKLSNDNLKKSLVDTFIDKIKVDFEDQLNDPDVGPKEIVELNQQLEDLKNSKSLAALKELDSSRADKINQSITEMTKELESAGLRDAIEQVKNARAAYTKNRFKDI